LEMGELNI